FPMTSRREQILWTGLYLATLITHGCGSGQSGATGRYGTLEFTATTDKAKYASGEVVSYTFNVRNAGAAAVVINYIGADSTGMNFVFPRIYRGSVLVLNPSTAGGSAQTQLTIAPGQAVSTTHTWYQVRDNGSTVGPGSYSMVLYLAAATVNGTAF